MKRFLIFVVICIVTASLGILTYKFLSVEETISVNQTVFEVNIGDTVPLEVIRENEKVSTEVIVESLNKDIVDYNNQSGKFYAEKGGKAILKVSSNLSGFTDILIQVTVGDGSKTSPLFVKNAIELSQIGTDERPLNLCYTLTNDLDLSSLEDGEWTPIGNNSEDGFTGTFSFNGHTISNLSLTNSSTTNAGLFAKIGVSGYVTGINLTDVTIDGSYTTAGSVAGINLGTIEYANITNLNITTDVNTESKIGGIAGINYYSIARSQVLGANIESLNNNSIIGGIVGLNETTSNSKIATIERARASANLNGDKIIGGIAGENFGGIITNCYTNTYALSDALTLGTISSDNNMAIVGGIVGYNVYKILESTSYDAIVKDTYTVAPIDGESTIVGSIIGYNDNQDESSKQINRIYGNYYSADETGISTGIGVGAYTFEDEQIGDGTHNKTIEELKQQSTFFSFVNKSSADIYWTFDKVWIVDGVDLPTLNYSGPYVSIGINTIYIQGNVDSYDSLILMRDNLSGTYLLTGDIDLSSIQNWIPIGTEESPFTGKFYNSGDYKITGLTISNSNTGLAGLFGYVGTDAVIDGIILEDTNINGGATVGALVAVNNGTILNSVVRGSSNNNTTTSATVSTTSTASSDVYLGGMVGINTGTIQDSYTLSGVLVRGSSINANVQYYVGGVVGSNESSGVISYIYSTAFVQTSLPLGYVGGLVGYNANKLSYSYFQGKLAGGYSAYDNTFVGGLVGYLSDNAFVEHSFSGSSADISGYQVGGILGLSFGTLTESYSESIITGVYAGGLAYGFYKNGAYNCYSGAYIVGYNSSSIKNGFAYHVKKINNVSASINNSFTRSTFGGSGTNYYETHQRCRVEYPYMKNGSGELNGCIYDKEIGGSAHRTDTRDTWVGIIQYIPGMLELSSYDRLDCPLTTAEAQGSDNFEAFRENNYDETKWTFENGSYPKLKNVIQEGQIQRVVDTNI